MAQVDTFTAQGAAEWVACEDLSQPGGAIALVPAAAAGGGASKTEWFTKGHSVFGSADDDSYYLNMSKASVIGAPNDALAVRLLSKNYSFLTWELVENAVPPIRHTGGVRAFVGSRGSSVDTTFGDTGEDAAGYGFPPALAYVFNLTNIAEGGKPILSRSSYLNDSLLAEGLVGGELPVVVFYYPVLPACPPVDTADDADAVRGKPKPPACNPYLPPSAKGARYWTMIASPEPDMHGSREQAVWFRFQQLECGAAVAADVTDPSCALVGKPQCKYTSNHSWIKQAPERFFVRRRRHSTRHPDLPSAHRTPPLRTHGRRRLLIRSHPTRF
jgi:hypothetical protein